jgi:hypothetical protein
MIAFPPDSVKQVDVYHLDKASGKESYALATTTSGAFLPLDRKDAVLEAGDYAVPYELYLEPQIDVRPSDKLIITVEVDGVQTATDFFVAHVFSAPFGEMGHKRISLTTRRSP